MRQQAGIEKSQTPIERDIPVQWVRNVYINIYLCVAMLTNTWILVEFR